jgi:heme-degrading monooxygenase HmoA
MWIVMLIRHKVRDFDAWEQVYEEFHDFRLHHGVRSHAVLRDLADPNQVVVMHAFDSTEAARAFFDSSELKQAMERAGVDRTTVTEEYFDSVDVGNLVESRTTRRSRTSKTPRAPTLLLRQRVADFDAWKKAYDDGLAVLRESGVRRHRVLRSLVDPNVVVIAATFDTLANARAFPDLPGLKQAMTDAGVEPSSVRVEHLNEVLTGAIIDAKDEATKSA